MLVAGSAVRVSKHPLYPSLNGVVGLVKNVVKATDAYYVHFKNGWDRDGTPKLIKNRKGHVLVSS